jgi:hypothetical protein
LGKQFDVIFEKSVGEMFFLFYSNGGTKNDGVVQSKYARIPAAGYSTTKQLARLVKANGFQRIEEKSVPSLPIGPESDSDEMPIGVVAKRLLQEYKTRWPGEHEVDAADLYPDLMVLREILSDSAVDIFPIVWFRYYLHEDQNTLLRKDHVEIEDLESFMRELADDVLMRRKEYSRSSAEHDPTRSGIPYDAQCLKLVVTSANRDTRMSRDCLDRFAEKCGLANAFYASMVTTVASMVVAAKGKKDAEESAQQARERLALLGDFPHNVDSHILSALDVQPSEAEMANLTSGMAKYFARQSSLRSYLRRRNTYLEFLAKNYDELPGKGDPKRRALMEGFLRKHVTTFSVVDVVNHIKDIRLFEGLVYGAESSDPDASSLQWQNVVKVSGRKTDLAKLECTSLRGAVENALENLLANSLKHAQMDGRKPIANIDKFQVSVGVALDAKEQNVVVTYSDNGRGFDDEAVAAVKSWLEGNGIDSSTGKGQGIFSIALSIVKIGGKVGFELRGSEKGKSANGTRVADSYHFVLSIPRAMPIFKQTVGSAEAE